MHSADPDAADADIENADAADSEADYEADSDADYEADNYDDADETRLTNKLNVCETFDSIFDGPDPNPDGRGETEIERSLTDETRPPDRHQRPTTTTSMIEMTAPK